MAKEEILQQIEEMSVKDLADLVPAVAETNACPEDDSLLTVFREQHRLYFGVRRPCHPIGKPFLESGLNLLRQKTFERLPHDFGCTMPADLFKVAIDVFDPAVPIQPEDKYANVLQQRAPASFVGRDFLAQAGRLCDLTSKNMIHREHHH